MDTQHLVDGFNTVLVDAHKAGVSLDDPIDRAMIVSTLMRLVELELECLDIEPCTLEAARKTIRELLLQLIHTQEIAVDRGSKLIALNEERLGSSKRDPTEAFDGGRLGQR